jgi:GMP synthase-like glutamine amidotransferase
MLILLGGPMSPNDDLPWIKQERELIKQVQEVGKPIFGACFGAQQIALVNGGVVKDAPAKEVGWAPVYLQSSRIPGLPQTTTVLHWHQQMFELPAGADLLFSSKLLKNQGFLLGDKVIGLQFHFEPETDNLREMVVNDGSYAERDNALKQSAADILRHGVPAENRTIMFKLLDYLAS